MSKYKVVSYLFLLLGILVIVGSAYVIISYANDIISAVVTFVTTNDYSKLQQCGITAPAEFTKLKAEFTTLILPALYLGLPLLLVVISALMFFSGFYYHKGKLEDDSRKHEQLEREMVHKIVRKMEAEKSPARKAQPSRMLEEEGEPPSAEESEEAPADEEPEEEEPPPRVARKKK